MMAQTVEGLEITVKRELEVMVDAAKVTQAEIEASNGVIHVSDSLIVPSLQYPGADALIIGWPRPAC